MIQVFNLILFKFIIIWCWIKLMTLNALADLEAPPPLPQTWRPPVSPNARKSGKNADQNNSEYGLFLRSPLLQKNRDREIIFENNYSYHMLITKNVRYYKVWHAVITKCARYYKVSKLLQMKGYSLFRLFVLVMLSFPA